MLVLRVVCCVFVVCLLLLCVVCFFLCVCCELVRGCSCFCVVDVCVWLLVVCCCLLIVVVILVVVLFVVRCSLCVDVCCSWL